MAERDPAAATGGQPPYPMPGAVCPPLLTVGIPTRNRPESLPRLLTSLARQRYAGRFEVIISDDGVPGQGGLGADALAELGRLFPSLAIRIVPGPRVNLPANRRNIMDHARTELVLMCDDDHILDEQCLSELVAAMHGRPDVGMVSAVWPDGSASTLDWDAAQGREDCLLTLDNIDETSPVRWLNGSAAFYSRHVNPRTLEAQFLGGGCVLFRKSAVLAAGGFPCGYSAVSFREDTDISHRIFLAGYRLLLNPKAMAWHQPQATGGCRDVPRVETLREADGRLFLSRLGQWRQQARSLAGRDLDADPIRVAMIYDVEGWAWWLRSNFVRRHVSSRVIVEPVKAGDRLRPKDYDFVVVLDAYMLERIGTVVPPEKLIVGCSCPKLLPNALAVLAHGHAKALLVNNYTAYAVARDHALVYCCQNGVDEALFHPSAATRPGATDRPLTACWVGNSDSIGLKGLDLIREACDAAGVRLLALDRAVDKQIRSQEWVRDNIYHQADVYICASQWEGTPNTALEALACGLPVISTPVGNMTELIMDGGNGYLVERSSQAIATALTTLKGADLSAMSRQAVETIHHAWTWAYQAVKYEKMFTDLLARVEQTRQAQGPSQPAQCVRQTRPTGPVDLGQPRQILMVRTDAIGDAVLGAGLIDSLAARFEGARISVACPPHVAVLWERCPHVAEVIPVDAARAAQDGSLRWQLLEKLRAKGFDLAINPMWSRTALADLLTLGNGAPITIGMDGDDHNCPAAELQRAGQGYTRLVADKAPRTDGLCEELSHAAALAAFLGLTGYQPRPMAWTNDADESFAADFFGRHQLDPARTIGLFCGVQHAVRRYDGYGWALRQVCAEQGLTIIGLGAEADRSATDAALRRLPGSHHNLAGQSTLPQAAALLRRCRMGVGAETGLAHLCAAVGTPLAVLLGGGHFGRFMPYASAPGQHLACLPLDCYGCNWRCTHKRPHCVRGLSPAVLETAIRAALQTDTQGSGAPRIYCQSPDSWRPAPEMPVWRYPYERLSQDADVSYVGKTAPAHAGATIPAGSATSSMTNNSTNYPTDYPADCAQRRRTTPSPASQPSAAIQGEATPAPSEKPMTHTSSSMSATTPAAGPGTSGPSPDLPKAHLETIMASVRLMLREAPWMLYNAPALLRDVGGLAAAAGRADWAGECLEGLTVVRSGSPEAAELRKRVDSANMQAEGRITLTVTASQAAMARRLGLSRAQCALLEDIDVMYGAHDAHGRRRRDAEVLTLMAANSAGKALEIGTAEGRSTWMLAVNARPGATVHTVNILPEQHDEASGHMVTDLHEKDKIGHYYRAKGQPNVVQHFANTLYWDMPEELSGLDYVFVDGGHDAHMVLNDSRKVWSRIKPGGFILWHDFNPEVRGRYDWIDAVMTGVEQFVAELGIDLEVLHLRHSWIGVARKPQDATATAPQPSGREPRICMDAPAGEHTAKVEDFRSLRYLLVTPGYSHAAIERDTRSAARMRAELKMNLSAFVFPCMGGWWDFPRLDAAYKARDPGLMRAYERLAQAAQGVDVVINGGGSMLHPRFVEQLSAFTVLQVADDPESTAILSRPVAQHYDFCFPMNAACISMYRSWGCENVAWLFHPADPAWRLPGVDETAILEGRGRDLDILMLCERVYGVSDRAQRVEWLKQRFPQAMVRGKGWPEGWLEDPAASWARTRIGWNLHNSIGPVNTRCFSLPAMGVMQLCDNKHHLAGIFSLGSEAAGFDTLEECAELTAYYLAHEQERREVAAAGFRRVWRDYTEEAWWRTIHGHIAQLVRAKAAKSQAA